MVDELAMMLDATDIDEEFETVGRWSTVCPSEDRLSSYQYATVFALPRCSRTLTYASPVPERDGAAAVMLMLFTSIRILKTETMEQ